MDTHIQLSRFWELEEISSIKPLSSQKRACEEHFTKTVQRAKNRRFIVSIPFKASADQLLGNSKQQALKQFSSLEHRLTSNSTLHKSYSDFMKEYKALGHMTKVTEENNDESVCFYMPHRGVLHKESLTTKLRVVFNGSAVTTSGYSLNNMQIVGPTILN